MIVYQYWNGEQVTDTLTATNAGGQRMPDKQNFNCVVGFHLLQDPITDENKTPCLSAGSSTGEESLGVCEEQSQAQYIVRRLTPLECERLQGYPDGWTVLRKIESMTDEEYEFYKAVYITDKEIKGKSVRKVPTKKQLINWHNKLDVDGTRYRQLGNSLAIPCALRVIGYIADYIRKGESKNEKNT